MEDFFFRFYEDSVYRWIEEKHLFPELNDMDARARSAYDQLREKLEGEPRTLALSMWDAMYLRAMCVGAQSFLYGLEIGRRSAVLLLGEES